jgi:hypothetical protein
MGHFLMRLVLLTSAMQHTRFWGNHTFTMLLKVETVSLLSDSVAKKSVIFF